MGPFGRNTRAWRSTVIPTGVKVRCPPRNPSCRAYAVPLALGLGAVLVSGAVPASAQAPPEPTLAITAEAMQVGRIYSATGVAIGGIAMINVAGSKAISLTPNTFGSDTNDFRTSKSEEPSVSNNGRMAFASNRSGKWRIYVANADGSGLRQVTTGDGSVPDDRRPVISPDGTRVAFVSRRPLTPGDPISHSTDIWMVNANGTNLQRLTQPEADGRGSSTIRSVDFNDAGTRLAYRGTRLVSDSGGAAIREVLGFIDVDGRNESTLRIDDCGGGGVLDWVGDSLLYSMGGNVQGCFPTKYVVRTVSTGASSTVEHATLGGATDTAGGARLSANARSILYTYGVAGDVTIARIGVDGSDRTLTKTRVIAPGVWLWWSAGAFPRPTSYVIEPRKVTVRAGGSKALRPILRDRKKAIVSTSGADWAWIDRPNAAYIDAVGRLTTSTTTLPGTYRASISNAGFTAVVTIIVR